MQAVMSEIIETYWNVNMCGSARQSNKRKEIIETYWNVNAVQDMISI